MRVTEPKRVPERPAKKAKTPTERVKNLDAALLASGGRILNRLRLSAEPASALQSLSERFGSDRAAIEKALMELDKRCAQR